MRSNGAAPAGWQYTKLKYLADVPITSGLGEAGQFDERSWPRYIRTTDIAGPWSLRSDVFASLPPEVASKAMLQQGDMLMTAAGATIGKSTTYVSEGPACYAGFLVRFRPRKDLVPRFISYWMQSQVYWDQINLGAVRSTIDNFSAGKYRDLELFLPPVDEQQRIASFLDEQTARLDRAIALRQRQLDLLPQTTRAAIREAVAGGVGSEGPAEAPWVAALHQRGRLQPLARTLTLQRGVDLTADQRRPGPYPVLTTAGENGHHDSYIVPGPGVVIGRYGSVGSVFWVNSPHWPHNTTLYVRDYKGNEPRYVYYLLKAYPYERLQARAAVPGVNRNDMAPDLMPWLPVSLQRLAVAECDRAEEGERRASGVLQRHLSLLQERKQALLTAAVTGRLDVAAAESVA